jgi:hypothetical protein
MRAAILLGPAMAFGFNHAAAQQTWTVDPRPVLDVPGTATDGSITFGYPAGATRLASGSLLVADRAENGVRLIDAQGKLVRTAGRTGGGPGEFQSIMWAGGCGTDSMLVWDARRRQASMIGASGTVARQFVVPASGDTAQPPFQFSCSGGRALAYVSAPRPMRGAGSAEPNIIPVTAAVYRISMNGAIIHRVGDFPAGEVLLTVSPTGGRGAMPRPLGRASVMAALGNDIVVSSADSARVTFLRGDGSSTVSAIPVTFRAPTRAELDAAIEATVSLVPPAMRQSAASQLAAAPVPRQLPPVSALFVDRDGMLWVQTTPPGSKTVEFIVMHADGRVAARAQVPSPLTVFEVGRDYILGASTDDNGEMHVVVHRLRRG